MSITNVIQWNGPPSMVAWRHGNATIMHGSQLIVQEHQHAVLMKEGRMIGPFLPGRHTLDTKNLPVLKTLIGATIAVFHTGADGTVRGLPQRESERAKVVRALYSRRQLRDANSALKRDRPQAAGPLSSALN